jgi:hypothetical protein
MDDQFNMLHLKLAFLGGFVIVAAGLVSLFEFHRLPFLSFAVGPLISFMAWRGLRDVQRRRNLAEVRMQAFRRRI